MSFGEVDIEYRSVTQDIQEIREIATLLKEDFDNANGGFQRLSDFIEGEMVDDLKTIVEILGRWCVRLIEILGGFCESFAMDVEKYAQADREGSEYLHEAFGGRGSMGGR